MNIDYQEAHKHSTNNREEINKSDTCGCFYCKEIFAPTEIKNWLGNTAQCPYCFVDSVIGNKSGFTITNQFLDMMKKHWFK